MDARLLCSSRGSEVCTAPPSGSAPHDPSSTFARCVLTHLLGALRDCFAAAATAPALDCSWLLGHQWRHGAAQATHPCCWQRLAVPRDTQSACCGCCSTVPTHERSTERARTRRILREAPCCMCCASSSRRRQRCRHTQSSRYQVASTLAFSSVRVLQSSLSGSSAVRGIRQTPRLARAPPIRYSATGPTRWRHSLASRRRGAAG